MSGLRHRHLFLALLLWSFLLLPGCGGPPAVEPDEIPIPEPLLEPMEPAVREQLQSLRQDLETLRRDVGTSKERLAAAYGELGMAYHAYELLDSAEACYANARRLEPAAALWPYAAGRLARDHRGNLPAALAAFEEAHRLAPEGAPGQAAILLHLALTHLMAGQTDEAEALFQQARRQGKEPAAALDGLGRVAAARQDEAAIAFFQQALELQPQAGRVWYRLAQALRRAGRLEEARQALGKQGSQDVRFEDPFEKQLAEAGRGVSSLVRQGAMAQLAGRFDRAAVLYRQAVDADPQDPAARQSLGAALTHLGDTAGALEQYEAAARLQPKNPDPLFNLGHLLIQAGRLDEARQRFQAALALDPNLWEANLGLASVAERKGDFPAALALYDQVLKVQPEHLETRSRRAVALAQSGRPQEALAALEALVQAAPAAAGPQLNLGTLEAQLGNFDRAQRSLEGALEASATPGERARALYLLGEIENRQGRSEAALKRFEAAVQETPTESDALRRLAEHRMRRGEAQKAAEVYSHWVQADPANTEARLALATALLLSGQPQAARDRLEEAVRQAPGDPRRALALAQVLAANPDPSLRDAPRALALALAIFKAAPSPEALEVLAMAQAATGDFPTAAQHQQQLLNQVTTQADPRTLTRLRENLERYRAGQVAGNPWGG